MRRPQFSLKTMLWLIGLIAAFFAGAEWQRRSDVECLAYKAWLRIYKQEGGLSNAPEPWEPRTQQGNGEDESE